MPSDILYHATPAANVVSILASGLLTARSAGRLKVVWLCTRSRRRWAVRHAAQRHATPVEEMAVFMVGIPKGTLLIHGQYRGLWRTLISADVPPAWLAGWLPAGIVTGL